MATTDGTRAFRARHEDDFGRTYFRRFDDLSVSSLGLGTYLGDPTDAVDDDYREAIVAALEGGCNVLDTAINYRHQRSERVVGEAIDEADVEREEVFVATKGGFVPFDGERPADPGAYVREEFIETGLVEPDDLAMGSHAMTPAYVDAMLDRSLSNLALDAVDLYYVHNPESQLRVRSEEDVYDQLQETFERLEERVAAGDVGAYGVATWKAFRVSSDHDSYLSLAEIVSRARQAAKAVGNDATGFRAIQLPFNVYMADAFTVEAQGSADDPESALSFAFDAGLAVFTSASIAQGDLAADIPGEVTELLAGETTVQRAINFARSAPGVTTSLVGSSSADHVAENLSAGTFDPLGARTFDSVFE
jgi:aryl-alcohol dehydrogenase-like predicted oxidoreductase